MTTSPLAQAVRAVRAGIKKAAADKALPPYPDGVTFRVISRRGSQMQSLDVEVLNVPRSWLYDARPGAVNRPSPAWLILREALAKIAARHFKADGEMTFIDVAVDPETERDA